ncbi:hypothetical protein PPL_12023 [Heterostelium album PN500]|uniref:Uncharacterized protein n=1 Tax=Heterostelium pallidum (strain ATCC 26659 / Pp 5 / PN500) TaxID=670386 RepID=D3BV51_HETP5|nr:hypothetical protein PPL_12023 [Heterostelium album PN500]EFA74989.1 hypothetical protein PPL_12023 [Heterostelium album PN500]|eukprot:XP_020427123.1 hypothetical protein PPL_12023 [Heterostelium album PN500]
MRAYIYLNAPHLRFNSEEAIEKLLQFMSILSTHIRIHQPHVYECNNDL